LIDAISTISDNVKSIDAKMSKSKDFKLLNFIATYKCTYEPPIKTFKLLNFIATYKCTYEPPIKTAVFTYKFEQPIELSSLDHDLALVDIET